MNSIYLYYESISNTNCTISITSSNPDNKIEVSAYNKISLFERLKDVKGLNSKWVNLNISYLGKKNGAPQALEKKIFVKRDDLKSFITKIGLNTDIFQKTEQTNSLERYLNQGISTKQRKELIYSDQDLVNCRIKYLG
jgi:hypothetical protein